MLDDELKRNDGKTLRQFLGKLKHGIVNQVQCFEKALVTAFSKHWDQVVGVSFLFRADPKARAAELGYPYLPQEVVTQEEYDVYCNQLKDIELDATDIDSLPDDDCATGARPVR